MGFVIALQGIRGGLGTSSLVAGLAWCLHSLGESVLLVDLSPDNLLRLHFNMPIDDSRGWARSQLDGEPWQDSAMRYVEEVKREQALDFLPFGTLSNEEKIRFELSNQTSPSKLEQFFSTITGFKQYQWILFDLPADNAPLTQRGVAAAQAVFCLLNLDANCNARLTTQTWIKSPYFLVNQYVPSFDLHMELSRRWQESSLQMIPVTIHRDEAVADAQANKQPVGEYDVNSLAHKEILTLANWCLIQWKTQNHA